MLIGHAREGTYMGYVNMDGWDDKILDGSSTITPGQYRAQTDGISCYYL
jgi:hypothetical protein